MRETSPRGWHRWRVAVVKPAPAVTTFERASRYRAPSVAEPPPPVSDMNSADGIRHDLGARVRQQIADGTYDTEEKWLLAEEALLRRVEGRL